MLREWNRGAVLLRCTGVSPPWLQRSPIDQKRVAEGLSGGFYGEECPVSLSVARSNPLGCVTALIRTQGVSNLSSRKRDRSEFCLMNLKCLKLSVFVWRDYW